MLCLTAKSLARVTASTTGGDWTSGTRIMSMTSTWDANEGDETVPTDDEGEGGSWMWMAGGFNRATRSRMLSSAVVTTVPSEFEVKELVSGVVEGAGSSNDGTGLGGLGAALWVRGVRIHGRIASSPSGVQWIAAQRASWGHDSPCMKGRHSAA
jgi:hypothetical protein